MKEAYLLLTNEFFGDENAERKFDQFFQFAWTANADYSKYRDQASQAGIIAKQIGDTAAHLSQLIEKMAKTWINVPGEFFSIPCLLKQTDSDQHNVGIWRAVRPSILGECKAKNQQTTDHDNEGEAKPLVIRFVMAQEDDVKIDPEEQQRNLINYAWEKSPDLSALLKTVATAADNFKPSTGCFIDGALVSNRRSRKTEYLRGLAKLLLDRDITLSSDIIKSIAITATVVLNDPDLIVTYDDARKAVAPKIV